MITNQQYAEWCVDLLVGEINRDYEKEAELERLCRQSEMLNRVEQTIGIFFACEDN